MLNASSRSAKPTSRPSKTSQLFAALTVALIVVLFARARPSLAVGDPHSANRGVKGPTAKPSAGDPTAAKPVSAISGNEGERAGESTTDGSKPADGSSPVSHSSSIAAPKLARPAASADRAPPAAPAELPAPVAPAGDSHNEDNEPSKKVPSFRQTSTEGSFSTLHSTSGTISTSPSPPIARRNATPAGRPAHAPVKKGSGGPWYAPGLRPVEHSMGITECDRPVVYNKPPKTGSELILQHFWVWAAKQRRSYYPCHRRDIQTDAQLRICVPKHPDPCGVLAHHLQLSRAGKQLLAERLPNLLFVTSTREPLQRTVSRYLEDLKVKVGQTFSAEEFDQAAFRRHLFERHNPWRHYNYHVQGSVSRETPLTPLWRDTIARLAEEYDVVIDASLRNASNAVLAQHGLFQLSGRRTNMRGSKMLNLSAETMRLVEKGSVVDVVLDDALMTRMALQYRNATGIDCLFDWPTPIVDSEDDGQLAQSIRACMAKADAL